MLAHPPLRGSFSALVLYDVAEQIRLDTLRSLAGMEAPPREPVFKHLAPDYVRFERPPVVELLGPVSMSAGESFQARIKYFEYGVVSVELRLDFEASWEELVRLSARWMAEPEIERRTAEISQRTTGAFTSRTSRPLRHLAERGLLHHSGDGRRWTIRASR